MKIEGFSVVCGFLIGALLMTVAAIYQKNIGRDECEAKLPRDQQCERIWILKKATNAR